MITKTINKEGEGGAIDKIITETKLHAYLEPLILQNLFDGHHLLCVDEASLVHHTKRPIPNDLQGFNRTGGQTEGQPIRWSTTNIYLISWKLQLLVFPFF